MTTYDYNSIPGRLGILIVVLSVLAIGNMALSLVDVMDGTAFKCVIALWTLVGFFGLDIAKNGYLQWRRQIRQQSLLLRPGGEFAGR
ncbi:MAG: hypothetical protein ACI8Z5_002104 [Lentimonas sp.]|jgi:hypothetical protein